MKRNNTLGIPRYCDVVVTHCRHLLIASIIHLGKLSLYMYDNTGRANSVIARHSTSDIKKTTCNLQSSEMFCAIVLFQ